MTHADINDDDAISRQAVFDLVRSLTRWCVRSEDGKFNNVGLLYDDVMFGIDKLPSVVHKSGKWEFHCQHWSKCSICGYADKFADKWNYCPNCGAKMENVEKSLIDIKAESSGC